MIETLRDRLRVGFPHIQEMLTANVSDVPLRLELELGLAQLYYVTNNAYSDNISSIEEYGTALISLARGTGKSIASLMSPYGEGFGDIIKHAVEETLQKQSVATSLLHEILKSEVDTLLFVDCAKSFLLSCVLKGVNGNPAHIEIGRTLTSLMQNQLDTFGFLQRFQLDRIRRAVRGYERVVGFFCPKQSFRKNFGGLPQRLAEKGYGVLYLYGVVAGDEFESHDTSFYVGGDLCSQLDCVHLFFTATIMKGLPESAKKALIIHGSFAPFYPEVHEKTVETEDEGNLPFEEQYQRALAARASFAAFFRLYDYYVVSSAYFHAMIESIADDYGLNICGKAGQSLGPRHQHFAVFNQSIVGTLLPEKIYVVPAGYPQIDVNTAAASNYHGARKVITYAPTPLDSKPVWNKYSSLYNAGEVIVDTLLRAFPDYEIVFKPHITEKNEETKNIVMKFSGRPRFRVDWSGSDYMKLYAQTAIFISDFSSTAYTYALSTLRPVLFYSPNEHLLPKALREEPYCREREHVGSVVSTPEDMVAAINTMLAPESTYAEKIRLFKEKIIFNVGGSEEYLCEAVQHMAYGTGAPTWTCFENCGAT